MSRLYQSRSNSAFHRLDDRPPPAGAARNGTVQTSWRPQLPLPKDKDYPQDHASKTSIIPSSTDTMDQLHTTPKQNNLPAHHHQQAHTAPAAMSNHPSSSSNPKKWSIGGLFRRNKKKDDSSTSEDDHKAGFSEKPRKSKPKSKRTTNKLMDAFDHIVVTPLSQRGSAAKPNPQCANQQDPRFFKEQLPLPVGAQTPPGSHRSTGSLDRRLRRDRIRAARIYSQDPHSSADEADSHSHNSSTMSRFRSDESLAHSGGSGSKRSRSARTERYMKRMSKCDDPAGGNRWKTQPISNTYQPHIWDHPNNQHPPQHGLRSSSSLTHVPSQPPLSIWHASARVKYPDPPVADHRSVSYENHLHRLDHQRGTPQAHVQPPPPPPRDPQRRFTLTVAPEPRPVSYAFDQNQSFDPMHQPRMTGRCVSDDRLWGPNATFQNGPQRPASVQPAPNAMPQRRFITRHDSAEKQSNPQPTEGVPSYRYVADTAPRSRRPIHAISNAPKAPVPESQETLMLRTTKSGLPSLSGNSAANFWRRIEQAESVKAATPPKPIMKPRSVSHSRVHPGRYHTNYDVDDVDGIVTGSLVLKPARSLTFSQPHQSDAKTKPFELSLPPSRVPLSYYTPKNEPAINKYEEHVAKTISQPFKGIAKPPAPAPPQRSVPLPPNSDSADEYSRPLRRKSTNLEDAINELEAIYKSLHLGEDAKKILTREDRNDFAAPTLFDQQILLDAARYDEDEDDDSRTKGEPDIVLDDVCYRNLKRANTIPRFAEAQPMFGIPIGPIPPSPGSDYLHVVKPPPSASNKPMFVAQKCPDPVSDDLAVRNLRKDATGRASEVPLPPRSVVMRNSAIEPTTETPVKKNKAVRSMSANIYNLIQRDAAKPSGGCLDDYSLLERRLNNNSLNDLTASNVSDHPSTLFMLQRERNLLEEKDSNTANRGAVFNLPSTLKTSPARSPSIQQKPPIPQPRAISLSPEPRLNTSGMEDILNAIAREAQESSAKLTRDLLELRQEIKAKTDAATSFKSLANAKLSADIDRVATAARDCENVLSTVVAKEPPVDKPKRKCDNEQAMLKDIQDVGEAAKLCEQMLDTAIFHSQDKTKSPKKPERTSAPSINQLPTPQSPKTQPKVVANTYPLSPKSQPRLIANIVTVEFKSNSPPPNDIPSKVPVSKPKLPPTALFKGYDSEEATSLPKKVVSSLDASPTPRKPADTIPDSSEEITSVAKLLEKLEPESKKIGAIAERCMRQLSELGDLHVVIAKKQALPFVGGDYDNLNPSFALTHHDKRTNEESSGPSEDGGSISIRSKPIEKSAEQSRMERKSAVQDQLDKIMAECAEEENKSHRQPTIETKFEVTSSSDENDEEMNIILLPPNAVTPTHPCDENTVSFGGNSPAPEEPHHNAKSSSDGGVKSSSCTPNRAHSSSITSFNAQSSSDFIKSSSSDYHLAQTHSDNMKTNSTTSYDVRSTSSPQMSNNESAFNSSPSPPLVLTPSGDDLSQYNSSEELAMIFGIRGETASGNPTTGDTDTTADASPTKSTSSSELRAAFASLATILETHEEHREAAVTIDDNEDDHDQQRRSFNSSINIEIAARDRTLDSGTTFSSMESIESTPDSGNVSLNEYPLAGGTEETARSEYPYRNEVTICTDAESGDRVYRSEASFVGSDGSFDSSEGESPVQQETVLEVLSIVDCESEQTLDDDIEFSAIYEQTLKSSGASESALSLGEIPMIAESVSLESTGINVVSINESEHFVEESDDLEASDLTLEPMDTFNDSVTDEVDLPECSSPQLTLDERFNNIFDELHVEADDEFFRCHTSLSLTTIHEDDEIDFMRIVSEHEADERMSSSSNSFKSIESECSRSVADECVIHSVVPTPISPPKPMATSTAPPKPNSIKSKILEFEKSLKGLNSSASSSKEASPKSKTSSPSRLVTSQSPRPTTSSQRPPNDPAAGSSVALENSAVHMFEPNHLLIACTVALATTDMLTLFAILIAIITILSMIWL